MEVVKTFLNDYSRIPQSSLSASPSVTAGGGVELRVNAWSRRGVQRQDRMKSKIDERRWTVTTGS
jgi:hypothetical protein